MTLCPHVAAVGFVLSETVNAPFGRMDTALAVVDLVVHSVVGKDLKERICHKPEESMRGCKPVSYTHLTLPTILLV